jgi:hypothetical protein
MFYTDYFIISLVKILAKVKAVLKIPHLDRSQRISEPILSSLCSMLFCRWKVVFFHLKNREEEGYLQSLLNKGLTGLFHLVPRGYASRYE